MARTLSDSIIISMIEAATRLAGGRGPVSGGPGGPGGPGGASGGAQSSAGGPAGQETGATTESTPAGGASGSSASGAGGASGAGATGAQGGEHDSRSAEQIAHDFRTIYLGIEEVVKSSAEQETKAIGFAPR